MSTPPVSGQRVDLGSGAVAWWPCHIGKDATIGADCSIGALAHIGQRAVLGNGCRIQGSAYIADECVLGERAFVGPAAVLLNDKYPPSGDRNKWQPVRVGDGAVIGECDARPWKQYGAQQCPRSGRSPDFTSA